MSKPRKRKRPRRAWRRTCDGAGEFTADLMVELIASAVIRAVVGVIRLFGRTLGSIFDGI